MKILHTGDIHLGELTGPIKNGENLRMLDTINCMNHLAKIAQDQGVDAIVIAGDLFHRSRLWADQMLKEIDIASDWLRKLASIAPTLLMLGTHNHDNPQAFENIRNMNIPNLWVVTQPELIAIPTNSGLLQAALVPGLDRSQIREDFSGLSVEEQNHRLTQYVADVIHNLDNQVDKNMPSVLISHYTVSGCSLDGEGYGTIKNDIMIDSKILRQTHFHLVMLGHIHRAQSIPNCGRPTYYCGAINGVSFNEEGQAKGFWIHSLQADVKSEFIATPHRRFTTIEWQEQDIRDWIEGRAIIDHGEGYIHIKDAIVRVLYTATDHTNKEFNRRMLEKELIKAGAFYVSEVKAVDILEQRVKSQLNENQTPLDNLTYWLEQQNISNQEINEVVELVKPMIQQVQANLPMARLKGVFQPISLEVKNYRSYAEQSFDFTTINFAIVTGPNGVGKSAFFMDAIIDCLYEHPREGDLTGWINNHPDVKSGTISFEFRIGDSGWRVVRTRSKGGKVSLSLEQKLEDGWVDKSTTRVKDTQQKIIDLLGMDLMTFKSCVLIMQDNYGVFLEAEKGERMQVLGNILGLEIYQHLAEVVKEKIRDLNRETGQLKATIDDLKENITQQRPMLQPLLEEAKDSLNKAEDGIREKEKQLDQLKETISKIKADIQRNGELQLQINEIKDMLSSLEDQRLKVQHEVVKAREILEQEQYINVKVKAYEATESQIQSLILKKNLIKQRQLELTRTTEFKLSLEGEIGGWIREVESIEQWIGNKAEVKDRAQRYDRLEQQIKDLNPLHQRYLKLEREEQEISSALLKVKGEKEKQQQEIKIQIKLTQEKAKMLEDSGCMDAPKSTCKFLKDAKDAKLALPILEEQLAAVDWGQYNILQQKLGEILEEKSQLRHLPQCYTKLVDSMEKLKEAKEDYIELISKKQLMKTLKEQIGIKQGQLSTLNNTINSINREIKDFDGVLADLDNLNSKLQALKYYYNEKDNLPRAKEIAEIYGKRLDEIEIQIKENNQRLGNIEEKKSNLCISIQDLKDYNERITKSEQSLRQLREVRDNLNREIIQYNIRLEDVENQEITLREKTEKLDPLIRELKNYGLLSKAFDSDGISFEIVRTVTRELAAKANEILREMTSGKMNLEIKTERILKSNKKEINALEIWISDYERGTMPYLSRSGGQKVKASLSVALAIAHLKAKRIGIQLGMMFIDEPPFLDAEGVQAYCDALEIMSQNYSSMRIIAISHDPTMKVRFTQHIEVTSTDQQSSIILY